MPAALFRSCSDEHAMLKHQTGEVDADLEATRAQLAKTQDDLAAAEVGAVCVRVSAGSCWFLMTVGCCSFELPVLS